MEFMACQCRSYVYLGGGGFSTTLRVQINDPSDWEQNQASLIYPSIVGYTICFDRLNEALIAIGHPSLSSGLEIFYQPEATTTGGVQIIQLSPGSDPIGNAICCDPLQNRIFYIDRRVAVAQLRKVNYDGTGDTLLDTWTPHTDFFYHPGDGIEYNSLQDTVYYNRDPSHLTGGAEFMRIQSDGTGSTLISTGSQIDAVTIDVQNQILMWSERGNAILSQDILGLGMPLEIYDLSGIGSLVECHFSQDEKKLYVANIPIVGNSIVRKMNSDGSENEYLGLFNFGMAGGFQLGKGFDITGPNAIL